MATGVGILAVRSPFLSIGILHFVYVKAMQQLLCTRGKGYVTFICTGTCPPTKYLFTRLQNFPLQMREKFGEKIGEKETSKSKHSKR